MFKVTRTTQGPWRLGGRGEFLVWPWRTGRIGIRSLGSAVRSTELGRQRWNSGGRSAPDGIDVRWLNRGLKIVRSDRGRTAWCTLTGKLEPVGSDSGKPVSGSCIGCAVERVANAAQTGLEWCARAYELSLWGERLSSARPAVYEGGFPRYRRGWYCRSPGAIWRGWVPLSCTLSWWGSS